jgi:hypothetical protein
MKHERVGVGAQFRNDERHPVDHRSADQVNVAAQPVELGDDDRVVSPPRGGQGGG